MAQVTGWKFTKLQNFGCQTWVSFPQHKHTNTAQGKRESLIQFVRKSRVNLVVKQGNSTFDDVPLFTDPTGLLGPQVQEQKVEKKETTAQLEDVELKSGKGMDYSLLKQCLQEGDFQKADDETRAKLIELAGEGAKARGWVYFTEVKTIPAEDLQTLDNLWLASSGGKFGYSVQKQLWKQTDQNWSKFFKKIDWTVGEQNFYRKWPQEFIYSTDAAKGHLPLTNCLRGTQLFEAIMGHEAFEAVSGEEVPEWMKA
eukprot:TRINITY_DN710_c0_g1_i1.p1 TRINITY_DN710_c0_g1~~TRINITY_DN710_c0_g1_i1.p1  ORF type:complete len:265 (+),score=40.21 TRINITY_DN710_c0_g1_i1:31-795(+)